MSETQEPFVGEGEKTVEAARAAIDVTPKMIDAGAEEWVLWDRDDMLEWVLPSLYRAMAVAAPSPWRPIESAPKDGTEVLVARGDCVTAAYCIDDIWWVVESQTDRGIVHEEQNWTHWMPLPAPPEAT